MNAYLHHLQIYPATEAGLASLAHIKSVCDPRMPVTANKIKASIQELQENPKQPATDYWLAIQHKFPVGMAYIKQYP